MAVNDVSCRPVDEDLSNPADLPKRAGQRALLLRRMRPPVARVGHKLGGGNVGVADDAVAPGRSRRVVHRQSHAGRSAALAASSHSSRPSIGMR
jgi:hypothetical protein